ncbi:LLM class flavin-dependent oxidoreductase [Nocardioides jishulii]|uniref:LLM class flavin-dependent oxidoreductase n=1 Tax=Nocardioides jishulii TaxID=2575440 RepID=A0A4U2YRB5_9ACTN|nr:LLM class flavin-dependent oxidoreductase [Nocardioides jishulii]QCX26288.1 LLM class flavin-dependent oxidoreductase [Nocardioides jishulii]TKI63908.1 LLM class flavin-dependent oxidoreductase [Nocardioides jishulii]
MPRQLVLNAFIHDVGHHEVAWRLPETRTDVQRDVTYFQDIARTAERGKLDSVFFADSPSTFGSTVARRPSEILEPALLLSAMAVVTERIGLIATSSTTYEEPYNLARTFASLDAISKGRAGWNVVTSADLTAGANFGYTEPLGHAERYARAEEFLEVVLGLWGGWEDGHRIADKANGVFHDPAKVHALDHVGEHFRVKGPLNVGRSEQGHPVVVQAGSSVPGIALAAKYAEAVFTAQPTLEEGQAFYAELKAATRKAGRNPDHVKILPGLVPIVGSTVEEARAIEKSLDDLVVLERPLAALAEQIGVPADQIDLDAPLPTDIRPASEIEGNRTRYELIVALARREDLTVRQLLLRLGGGRGHRTYVGTPEQVADTIQEWFTSGAADGFNIMPAIYPSGLETFVDHVVPVLQDRGLFRRDYAGTTLRDHYGLPVPAPLGAASGAGVGASSGGAAATTERTA